MNKMTTWALIWLLLSCNGAVASPAGARQIWRPANGYTIYVVPHSHLDMEWYWPYEQTQEISIRILRQVLTLLKEDPRFAFTQDQLYALKPFWESLSDGDKAFLRRMVSEGRFEVATGMLVQPDVDVPDFESLTRQFLLARPWLQETFGARITTAWNVDAAGQTNQMPQLYHGAGLQYSFFQRDVPPAIKDSTDNLFYWQSPDGSRVLNHEGYYWLGYELHAKELLRPEEAGLGPSEFLDLVRRNPKGNEKLMVPWGTDRYFPNEDSKQIEAVVRQAVAKLGIRVHAIVISTASKYFEDVEKSGVTLPTYTYDYNPPFATQDLRGVWAERPRLKLAERRAEDMLESSEKLASVASALGAPYPSSDLSWSWRTLLFNQNHDTIEGSNADTVYHTAMSRYYGVLESARQTESTAAFEISRHVDTSATGDFPIVVLNTLSYPRSEIVHYSHTFVKAMSLADARQEIHNFRLLDSLGRSIPFRVVSVSRIPPLATGDPSEPQGKDDGRLSMTDIEFLAEDIPALGYRVYQIEPLEGHIEPSQWHPLQGDISSPYFDIGIDPSTGSVSKLVDRRSGSALLKGDGKGSNELVLLKENNPSMEGTFDFTGAQLRASEFRPDSIMSMTDDLGTIVRVEAPFMGGTRVQEIALYNQSPRIDFKTELKGISGQDGILTVEFPIDRAKNPMTLYETHNSVTSRPDGIYDAGTWVDVENSSSGVALINRGTAGYQIEGDRARIILLRSLTHYSGYHVPEAAESGDHTFSYALYPHRGNWVDSHVSAEAHSFNSALRVLPTDAHAGALPLEHSFLSVDSGHFEVTALKKADHGDEFIVRGHETEGRTGSVRLNISLPIQQAWRADLVERQSEEVNVENGRISFECKPFEFVTIRLKLMP